MDNTYEFILKQTWLDRKQIIHTNTNVFIKNLFTVPNYIQKLKIVWTSPTFASEQNKHLYLFYNYLEIKDSCTC